MKILGMGAPEMLIVVFTLALYALAAFVLYLIIKKAVKNGIIEARKQIESEESAHPVPTVPVDKV